MVNIDDQELIRQVALGDEDSFLALYERYAAQVHGLTLRILSDPMMAEEATQDTFLKLWSRARLYLAERGSVLVWLLTIARRTALDRLRLENRRPLLSSGDDPETLWQLIPDGKTANEEARWRTLQMTVASLSPVHRQVIELAFYQGLSQREISEILGWPLGTVKTRLRAAMEQLRRSWS